MEFKHTLEVLCAQADEIRNLAAKLGQSDDLRTIDLDLLLEKLRNVYDLVLDLESTVGKDSKQESRPIRGKPIITSVPDDSVESEHRPPESEKKAEAEIQVVEKKEKPVQEVTSSHEKTKTEDAPREKKYVSDRFKGSKHTLHEEMAGRSRQDDISSQYKTKPISNIMSAIALNDRFELISQLFNGDKERFESTIEVLNNAGSFVDAYNYLQENFKWDMDNEYVQRILELIRRKLIVHGNE
jgi:hypothetical protein